jgi:hypothetical protein
MLSSYGPRTFDNNYVVISSATTGCCFISGSANIYHSVLNAPPRSATVTFCYCCCFSFMAL